MLDKLGSAYLRSKIWLKCKVEDFKENEMGVSGIVAAIILVAITLLLVTVFWKQIKGIVEKWFGIISTNDGGDTTINTGAPAGGTGAPAGGTGAPAGGTGGH